MFTEYPTKKKKYLTDIDECSPTNPCTNGGSCTNTAGSFVCTCLDNWTGQTCTDGKTS